MLLKLERFIFELKDAGLDKVVCTMVNRYAKYATEHLTVAAARIEQGRCEGIAVKFPTHPP